MKNGFRISKLTPGGEKEQNEQFLAKLQLNTLQSLNQSDCFSDAIT